MNGPQFPLWQIDRVEYGHVCHHLGLQPDGQVFDRLQRHLARVALEHAQPGPLARALARPSLTRWRVARLDLASRLLFPDHPVRHVLNAVLALHECTGDGYAELSRAPTGAAIWPSLAAELARFAASAAITLPWLLLQGLIWALRRPFGQDRDLAGRHVLVTGVARGLGHDLMLESLERGARVVGTVRSAAARDALAHTLPRTGRLTLVGADQSQPDAIVAGLSTAGVDPEVIDLAILCAGVKHEGHTVLDLARLRDTLQVNLLASAEVAAWLYPPGRAGRADLAVVSSIGRWHGMHSTAGYNASKAALSIWAESLEMDLARRSHARSRVTVVEPGLFESQMAARSGLRALLMTPRRRLAGRIIDAVAAHRRTLRAPGLFALITWLVCLSGRAVRLRLFARAKS